MGDVIRGTVTAVFDGEVIIISLSGVAQSNVGKYNKVERIKIIGGESYEIFGPAGERTKEGLEKALVGKIIMCYVESRDDKNRILASIKVI